MDRVKVNPNGRLFKMGMRAIEGSIAKPQGLEHQGQFPSKDPVAPSGRTRDQAAAYVAVDVEGRAVLAGRPVSQYFVSQ